jgi:hypothetical protein
MTSTLIRGPDVCKIALFTSSLVSRTAVSKSMALAIGASTSLRKRRDAAALSAARGNVREAC